MRAIVLTCSLPLCLLAIAGAAAHAQSSAPMPPPSACPWLTQGSAARALGGEVSVAVNISNTGEGWCSFSRKQSEASLRIEVSKTALTSCGADSAKLRGVGNEAMRCRLAGSSEHDAQLISGRVRDLHFTIAFNPHGQRNPDSSAGAQEDVLQLVAEQVAGNLF